MNAWTWLRAEWDRVAGFGFVVIGAVLLFLGFRGVETSPFLAEELAYIASGGLGGLFCLGLGVGLLICAGLHDEWYKLDRIEAAIRGEGLPDSTTMLNQLTAERSGNGRQPLTPQPTALAMDWRATHRAPAVTIVTLALLFPLALATAGWQRARHTPDLNVATQGLALAIAGTAIGLAVIAGYTALLRARFVRREGQLLRHYLPAAALTVATAPAPDTVVVAAGLRRFHRPGCPALAGLEASAVPRGSLGDGHDPCGICGA